MNSKIKDLFIKAGGQLKVDASGNEWTYTQDLDPEFFAKLVIMDCVEIANKSVISEQSLVGIRINDYFRE
jgi:hypothetical protein